MPVTCKVLSVSGASYSPPSTTVSYDCSAPLLASSFRSLLHSVLLSSGHISVTDDIAVLLPPVPSRCNTLELLGKCKEDVMYKPWLDDPSVKSAYGSASISSISSNLQLERGLSDVNKFTKSDFHYR